MTPHEPSARPHTAVIATLAAVLTVVFLLAAPSPAAHAADPPVLSANGQITDQVNALGDRRGAVARAIDALYEKRHIQLFVVYVKDFSGRTAQDWARATASRNGLGQDDILLALGTQARQYAYTGQSGTTKFTNAQLEAVARKAIDPPLAQHDWAGTAIGAANGYSAIVAGQPVPTPAITPGASDPGGHSTVGMGNGALLVPLALVVVVGGLAIYAYTRRRRRAETRTTPAGSAQQQGWSGTGGIALAQLDTEAGKLLVGTDDAVRTSTEELGLAIARFGDGAAEPYTAALTYARTELARAFRLRQQLDDSCPEDEAARRQMLEELVARCTEAGRRLDEEAADFDRLRALEQDAPQALAAAETAFRTAAARTGAAGSTLTALREQYAEPASAPVAGNVEQAKDRLLFATNGLNRARQAVDTGEYAEAALYVRAAESAVGQAATLIDAVDRLAGEVAEAEVRLAGALTETEADLTEARALPGATAAGAAGADLHSRIERAETVTAGVRQEQSAGPYDPVDALRRVGEAHASLDKAIGPRRTVGLLEAATLTARSRTGAAADYLTTHRGAIGSQARTRLAEAQRHLEESGTLAATEVQRALAGAQQADSLAGQAQYLAEQDVRTYGTRPGGDPGGALLGGIVIGGPLGAGGAPVRFGGAGTRGRMGGDR
ncbi:TPM domain-containing protein [Streptomyces sp. NBC_01180]|uniref:TPM domain-containing protein n=1 Tax=Streptomyces sp. NBC_01180 TaxID=2903763 RepID=UPI003868C8BE|nr:TPM domain-containing protein [Streptomyces sp. NBC_01180]